VIPSTHAHNFNTVAILGPVCILELVVEYRATKRGYSHDLEDY